MLSALRQLRLVRKSIVKEIKRIALPFGIVSSSFLLFGFEKAHAQMPSAYQLGRSFSGDLNSSVFATWGKIGEWIVNFGNWIINLPENITKLSITLLMELYEMLMFIALQTPLFIFTNSYLKDATMTFSGVSVIIVVILTMFEGFKRKFMKKHNDLTTISKRWFLAILGTGAAPFLFENVFRFLNYLTQAIVKIGKDRIESNPNIFNEFGISEFHIGFLILFDLIVIALMIPLILQNFRRWTMLMCLASISPLALSAWVFDEHRHYFNKWWNSVKQLSMVQLVYAVFITIMGLFVFGTSNIVSGWGLLVKIGVVIGGLQILANPPNFVKNKLYKGGDITEVGDDMRKTYTNVAETVTLKKFDPLYQAKKKVATAVVNKFKKN